MASSHSSVFLMMQCVLLAVVLQLSFANLIINAETQQLTSDITCWTCPSMYSNGECNDWAPDVKCPINNTVCKTIHTMDRTTGESVSVIKLCAPPSECDPRTVGCTDLSNTNHKMCISCCDRPYCNVAVPVNTTTAISLSSFTSGATPRRMDAHLLTLSLVVVFSIFASRVVNGQG